MLSLLVTGRISLLRSEASKGLPFAIDISLLWSEEYSESHLVLESTYQSWKPTNEKSKSGVLVRLQVGKNPYWAWTTVLTRRLSLTRIRAKKQPSRRAKTRED